MIPVPDLSEACDVWPLPGDRLPRAVAGQPRAPRMAAPRPLAMAVPSDELGIGALLRFKAMMAADGQPVSLARLCDDRHYAYERIATAHASGNAALRALALELFQIYHRRGAAGLPSQ